jgi:hypothetical protein
VLKGTEEKKRLLSEYRGEEMKGKQRYRKIPLPPQKSAVIFPPPSVGSFCYGNSFQSQVYLRSFFFLVWQNLLHFLPHPNILESDFFAPAAPLAGSRLL